MRSEYKTRLASCNVQGNERPRARRERYSGPSMAPRSEPRHDADLGFGQSAGSAVPVGYPTLVAATYLQTV